MKYTRALGGFRDMRDAELLRRALAILEAMGSNTDIFANPTPPLSEVQDATDDYRAKLVIASQTKGLYDISLKNETRQALENILQRLAFYVNTLADAHLPTLYASGFLITPPRITGLHPSVPERLRAVDGPVSGSMRLDFDKVAGSGISYEYILAHEPEDEAPLQWADPVYTSSSRNNLIHSLQRKTEVSIRVRAVNANGVSDWSDTIRHIVR